MGFNYCIYYGEYGCWIFEIFWCEQMFVEVVFYRECGDNGELLVLVCVRMVWV